MTYSSCLHDQQDLCWGNTSRDTSEEPQEPQEEQSKRFEGTPNYLHILILFYLLCSHVVTSTKSKLFVTYTFVCP